ncbi:hypothetical protein [Caproiciproducens sp.]
MMDRRGHKQCDRRHQKAVDNGQLALTLDSNNRGLGSTGLETALKLINGETVDAVIPLCT